MNTKVFYTTINNKRFKTILPVEPVEKLVLAYMNETYNMRGIIKFSFKPTKMTKYKKCRNVEIR